MVADVAARQYVDSPAIRFGAGDRTVMMPPEIPPEVAECLAKLPAPAR